MHTKDEIYNGGRNQLGNLDQNWLNKQEKVTVRTYLKHSEDGVIYGYEVNFIKTQVDGITAWRPVGQMPITSPDFPENHG